MWKAFSTGFTVIGIAVLLAGVCSWHQGWISLEGLTARRAQAQAPEPAPETAEKAEPAPDAAPPLDEGEARNWFFRMEASRKKLAGKETELQMREEALENGQEALAAMDRALCELLGAVFPDDPAPEAGTLLADAKAREGILAKLRQRAAGAGRMPELLTTITEMQPEDAAVLLGEHLEPAIASEILWRLDAEGRAAILGKLVKANPLKAGELFARLAGGEEKG